MSPPSEPIFRSITDADDTVDSLDCTEMLSVEALNFRLNKAAARDFPLLGFGRMDSVSVCTSSGLCASVDFCFDFLSDDGFLLMGSSRAEIDKAFRSRDFNPPAFIIAAVGVGASVRSPSSLLALSLLSGEAAIVGCCDNGEGFLIGRADDETEDVGEALAAGEAGDVGDMGDFTLGGLILGGLILGVDVRVVEVEEVVLALLADGPRW
jgi:hypothetical protein